jgi:small-conductance mechanosensitive channel
LSVTIGWLRMGGSRAFIFASSLLNKYSHQLTALLAGVLTVVCAVLADRAISHWAARADLDPGVDTRVRFIRRLITVTICVIGVLIAVSEFGGLNKLAAGLLASSAIIAAVVGFAARQTLANLIAGVMLTIAQPLRIGDQITIRDQSGTVEDVRLNYTLLRTVDGRRWLIPNELLAAEMIRNDTILDDRVHPEASVWLPGDGDVETAVSNLAAIEPGLVVRVAEVTPDGVRIALTAEPIPAPQRAAREADLRAAALRSLRGPGLLS